MSELGREKERKKNTQVYHKSLTSYRNYGFLLFLPLKKKQSAIEDKCLVMTYKDVNYFSSNSGFENLSPPTRNK